MLVKTAVIVSGALLVAASTPTAASAKPPVGRCPDDYTSYTRAEVENFPDAALALAAFDAVNANGDELVCYKPYRNGAHNGHFGNFVDNTAGPHT